MKVINKQLLLANGFEKYAISEAHILKSIKHPFILSLYFSFQTKKSLYMIVDYCPGGDMARLLEEITVLTIEEAKFYMAEILLALETLHSQGVLYRDLKPENILIDSLGHIKLADFGLSKEGIQKEDIAQSICGSPIYFSPEIVSQKGTTHASDIYGFGLILYEMLMGDPPFLSEYASISPDGNNIGALYKLIRESSVPYPEDLEPEARDLLEKLLDKDPTKRIGVNNKSEIKNHPFFEGVDWDAFLNKRVPAPYVDDPNLIEFPNRKFHHDDHDYSNDKNKQLYIPDFDYIDESEIEGKLIQYATESVISNPQELSLSLSSKSQYSIKLN